MIHLLDTNLCIDHLRKRGSGALRRALTRIDIAEMAICSVVLAELLAGCHRADDPAKAFQGVRDLQMMFRSLPFDDAAAEHFGEIYAVLKLKRTPIGHNDLLIAAIARANGLIVVTQNIGEFSRVPNLQIEDWQATP